MERIRIGGVSIPVGRPGTAARLAGAAAVFLTLGAALAQEGQAPPAPAAGGLSVERAVIAARVENREPAGEAASFPESAGQVACFSKITGAEGETSVSHVWKHEGTEKARVQLRVMGPSWRTWSVKQLHPGSAGKWTVEIQTADGAILKSVEFTVE